MKAAVPSQVVMCWALDGVKIEELLKVNYNATSLLLK